MSPATSEIAARSACAHRRPKTGWTVIAAACVLAHVLTCQSNSNSAQAQSQSSSRSGVTVVALPDPSFGGLPAAFVAVPMGWQADGQMTTNPCANLPSPAWHAASPDGKSDFDVLPMLAWRWGAGAKFGRGCAPFSGQPQAADFLKLFASKLPDVQVVGTMPVSAKYRDREVNFVAKVNDNSQVAAAYRTQSSGDVAALRAVDGHRNEMRLRVWVVCRQGRSGGNCFARPDILRAPKGRLDALAAQVDSQNLVQEIPSQTWVKAYQNHQNEVAGRYSQQLHAEVASGNKMLRDQYEQSTASLRERHEAGMQQLQAQGQSAMRNANNDLQARSTAASDWRDYAADQQTVSGANGTYKTSSQYSNIWSSPYGPPLSNGRSFGSTDNTLDPNTATDSTWTQDHKVHGNGQPY